MYQDLDVWKKSIELVKEIYLITNEFPQEERYSLTAQIRRAAVSIPSNIAEGAGRYSDKESARFMDITLGSISEVETQLIIAKELGFIETIEDTLNNLKEIYKMTISLKKFYDK